MAATTQGPRRSTPLPHGPERPGVDRTCRSAAAAEGSVGNRADGFGPRSGVCPGARPDPGRCDPVDHGPGEDLPVASPADADRCVLRPVATRRCGPVRSEVRRCGIRPCDLHRTNVSRPLGALRRGRHHARRLRLVTCPGARRCPAYRRSAVLLRRGRTTWCRMSWYRMSWYRMTELPDRFRRIGVPRIERHRCGDRSPAPATRRVLTIWCRMSGVHRSATPPRTLQMAHESLNANPGSLYCAAADERHRRSQVAAGAVGRWRGWASGPLQQRRRLEREWPRYRTQRSDPHARRGGKNGEGEALSRLPFEKSGGVLLSQGRTSQVPSALEGLTSVFGMGTGVTPPLWPPKSVVN